MRIVRFTHAGADFIGHRLACGDALADVLTDHADDDAPGLPGYSWDDVYQRARELSDELARTGAVTVEPSSPLDAGIMRDCVAGSTWLSDSSTYLEPPARAAAFRTVKAAAETRAAAFDWPSAPEIEIL